MGLIKRLQRLTVSRIEAFLNTVEDPELLYPQLVREMEDQVRAAADAEAKAMVSVKSLQRETAQAEAKRARMEKGAELAMKRGDEATAREAVSAQLDLDAEVARKTEALSKAQATVADAKQARAQIQSQLDEVRAKKDEILTRARLAKTQKKIAKTVHGPVGSAKSILDAVAQMEAKVEETEAQLDVQREMTGEKGQPSLAKRLDSLETEDQVEQRLANLKKKITGA